MSETPLYSRAGRIDEKMGVRMHTYLHIPDYLIGAAVNAFDDALLFDSYQASMGGRESTG